MLKNSWQEWHSLSDALLQSISTWICTERQREVWESRERRRACGRRGVCLEGNVWGGGGGGGAGGGERMEEIGGARPGLTNGLQMLPPHTTPEHLSVWTT